MEILGTILSGVGMIGYLVCGIWLLVRIFQRSIGWGIASLLLGIPALIFVAMNWSYTKKQFLLSILFFVILGIGGALGGAAFLNSVPELPAAIPTP